MKTITIQRPALSMPSSSAVSVRKFFNRFSIVSFTRTFNNITGEKFTAAEMKVILCLGTLFVCACNAYLWPFMLIPALILMKKGGKR